MIDEERLSEIVPQHVPIRLVEPHIYSFQSPGENTNAYDRMGTVYDLVARSRIYNRLVWGYWTSDYHSLCIDALTSSKNGWVLDAGCGSLAFTTRAYANYSERPIVFLDQSMKMLLLAKSRLVSLTGSVPANTVFVHGDVLHLPFNPKSFGTIIVLNVLHVLEDLRGVLEGLRVVLMDGGKISMTTLIQNNRLADKYLRLLGRAGAVVPRTANQVFTEFDTLGMPIKYRIKGNLAFIQQG